MDGLVSLEAWVKDELQLFLMRCKEHLLQLNG